MTTDLLASLISIWLPGRCSTPSTRPSVRPAVSPNSFGVKGSEKLVAAADQSDLRLAISPYAQPSREEP
jgi:hypothetical protein